MQQPSASSGGVLCPGMAAQLKPHTLLSLLFFFPLELGYLRPGYHHTQREDSIMGRNNQKEAADNPFVQQASQQGTMVEQSEVIEVHADWNEILSHVAKEGKIRFPHVHHMNKGKHSHCKGSERPPPVP